MNSQNPVAYRYLAAVLRRKGRHDEAISALHRQIKLTAGEGGSHQGAHEGRAGSCGRDEAG